MPSLRLSFSSLLLVAPFLLLSACQRGDTEAATARDTVLHVAAPSQVEAGRYLTTVANCNDCHTAGFMQDPNLPESERLMGSPVGWRGPWGTTYAPNLRLVASDLTPDAWVQLIRSRDAKPPMPWANLHEASDRDLKAIHAYLLSLGPAGDTVPDALPPGEEPETPYRVMMPQTPGERQGG